MKINKIYLFPWKRISLLAAWLSLGACTGLSAQGGPLQLSFSITQPTCAGAQDGAATATASNGTGPFTYEWDNGQQGPTLSGIGAGTYYVTATASSGNTGEASVTVTEPTVLKGNVITVQPSCNGSNGRMMASASGGTAPYTYTWSNGTMGATASNLQPDVPYTVTISDSKACQWISAPQLLAEITGLGVSLSLTKAECSGVDNGTATAFVTPPGGNYQYQWNVSPLNFPQITGLAAGTFVAVTVTDLSSGCTGQASGTVIAHTQIKLKLTPSGNVFCQSDTTGSISATASHGTAPYTFVWNGPGVDHVSGPVLTGLGPGTYTVTVTDARGCTETGTATIGVISGLQAGLSWVENCQGNQFSIQFTDQSDDPTSTIVAWQWSITWGGNTITSTAQNPAPVLLPNQTEGTVQLIVTSQTGCQDTVVRPFAVNTLLGFEIQTDGFACDGAAVGIQVLGDSTFTYTWSPTDHLSFQPGPQQVLANPPVTTSYVLTVSNGICFDSDTVTIIRQPILELTAPDIQTCDSTVTLTATTNVPANIVWTNMAGQPVNPAAAGEGVYLVTATDSFHCVRVDTVLVDIRAVRVQATVPEAACANIPFPLLAQNLEPGDVLNYQWTAVPAGLVIADPGLASTTASGPAGQYVVTLTATNQFGCIRTFIFPVVIQDAFDISNQISIRHECNSLVVTFVNHSPFSGTWNFGDGVGTSTADSVTYQYAGPGNYTVTFVPNAVCVVPFTQTVPVTPGIFGLVAPDILSCDSLVALSANTTLPATLVWTDVQGNPVVNPASVPAGTYIVTATFTTDCILTDTVTVTSSPVQVEASADTLVCEGTPVLLLAVNQASGDVVQYQWSAAPATLVIANPTSASTTASGPAGQYTVTLVATNQAGCTRSFTFPVSIVPTTDISALIDIDQACNSTAVTFDNNSGFPGVWTFGDGIGSSTADSVTYTYATAGTYTVTFVSSAPCVLPFSQNLTVSGDVFTVTANDISTCDSTVALSASTSQPGTITWTDLAGNPVNPAAVPPGTYIALGVDNLQQCSDSDTLTVTALPPANVTASVQPTACAGSPVSLEASNLTPGDVVQYQWSATPATLVIANPTSASTTASGPAGQYTVTLVATNQAGCTRSFTFPVSIVPTTDISALIDIDQACNSTAVTFDNNSGFPGTWNFGDGIGSSTADSVTYTYATAGTYTVTFVSSAPCVLPFSQNLTVSGDLFTVTANDISTCDSTAALTASTNLPGTITWTDLAGNPVNPAAVPPGTYIALGVDNLQQCSDTDTLTVTTLPPANVSASVQPTACAGSPVSLEASNLTPGDVVQYQWSAAPATLVIANPTAASTTASGPAGQYTVTLVATNQAGCTRSFTFPVSIVPATDISALIDIDQACNSTAVTFDNNSGFPGVWNFGDGIGSSTADSVTYTYATAGTYTVTFVSSAPCVLPFSENLNVTDVFFTVTANDISTCDSTAALTASTNLPGTITWTDQTGYPVNPAAVPPGTYIALGVDNLQQCSDSDTLTVTALPPANVSASVQPTACAGSPVSLEASNLTPGDVVQYQWSAAPATLVIANPAAASTTASGPAGQYTVTLVATNQAGCTRSFTFPVSIVPTTDISALIDIDQACNSIAVTFDNNSGFPGVWNFGDGIGSSTADSVTYTYATAGTYTVTFVSSAPCVLPFSENLNVTDEFFTVTANDISICDSTAALTASTNLPGTITWTDLAGNPVNPAAVPPGTYIALGVDNLQQCSDTDTLTVTALPPANVTASVQPTACAGSPILLQADAQTPGEVLQYQWSATPPTLVIVDPSSGNTLASGPAGQYTVTLVVTNQAGCTQALSFPLSVLPTTNISALIDIDQACNSTAVTFDNNSGFPGTWNFGDGIGSSTADSLVYTYATAGTYTVTFVSSAPCVLPFSQNLSVTDEFFTVTANDISICDSTAALTASTNLPGTIIWTDLAGNPVNPAAVPPGTYIALGVDNLQQCSDTDTLTVTALPPANVTASVQPTACVGSPVSLEASNLTHGDVVQYQWSATPATLVIANPTADSTTASGPVGQYTVTLVATNQAGCTQSFNFPVTILPAIDISPLIDIDQACNSTAVTFDNNSGFPGVWTFGDGSGSSTADSVTYTYDSAGVYLVTFVSTTACVLPFSQAVTVTDSIFSVNGTDIFTCDSLALNTLAATTSLPGSISWTDLNGNPILPNAVLPGTYIATAINLDETCVDTDTVTIAYVPANAEPSPAGQLICLGSDATLGVTNLNPSDSLTYQWSNGLPGVANPEVSPLQNTSYQVTVTNQYGCSAVIGMEVQVLSVTVSAEITGKDTICTGQSTTLLATAGGNAGTYTYAWSPAETLDNPNVPDPIATPSGQQTYTVTVTGDGLCTATDAVTVYFMETECAEPYIFVPKAFTPNDDGNNDRFRVRGADITSIYFIVYDRWGEEMYRTEDPDHIGWDGTYKGKASTPDSYGWYLRVTCGNGQVFESKGDVTLLK